MAIVRIELDQRTEMDRFKAENDALIREIYDLNKRIKDMQSKQEELKERLMLNMEEHCIKSIETDCCNVSIIRGSKYTSIDSKRLKNDYPSIFDRYSNVRYQKDHLAIRGLR